MIIALVSLLWLLFISLIYLGFSPIIAGLSMRGAEFLLEPDVLFAGLLAGELLLLSGLALRRRQHRYNVPLYLAGMAGLAVLAGAFVSVPLLVTGILFQLAAFYLDSKAQPQSQDLAEGDRSS